MRATTARRIRRALAGGLSLDPARRPSKPIQFVDSLRPAPFRLTHPRTRRGRAALASALATILSIGVAMPFALRGPAVTTVSAEVTVGEAPSDVAVDPTSHRAYVTSPSGNEITILDSQSGRVLRRIEAKGGPSAVAIDPIKGTAHVVSQPLEGTAVDAGEGDESDNKMRIWTIRGTVVVDEREVFGGGTCATEDPCAMGIAFDPLKGEIVPSGAEDREKEYVKGVCDVGPYCVSSSRGSATAYNPGVDRTLASIRQISTMTEDFGAACHKGDLVISPRKGTEQSPSHPVPLFLGDYACVDLAIDGSRDELLIAGVKQRAPPLVRAPVNSFEFASDTEIAPEPTEGVVIAVPFEATPRGVELGVARIVASGLGRPTALRVDERKGTIVVTDKSRNALYAIERDGRPTRMIRVGIGGPGPVAIDSSTGSVLVANTGRDTVRIISREELDRASSVSTQPPVDPFLFAAATTYPGVNQLGFDDTGSYECGGEHTLNVPGGPSALDRDQAAGRNEHLPKHTIKVSTPGLYYGLKGVSISTDDNWPVLRPAWCLDMLGDGRGAIAYVKSKGLSAEERAKFEIRTLGRVFPWDTESGPRSILEVSDLSLQAVEGPFQLDRTRPLEVVGSSLLTIDRGSVLFLPDVHSWELMGDSASFRLPSIWAFDGTRYQEATRRFPEVIKASLLIAEGLLGERISAAETDSGVNTNNQTEELSAALAVAGHHLLLGAEDQLTRMEQKLKPNARHVFRKLVEELKAVLRDAYAKS